MAWLLFCVMAPVQGSSRGRYSLPYEKDVRVHLKLADPRSRDDERLALARFLAENELPESTRYSALRQLLFLSEFSSDPQAFELTRAMMKPKADDYLLLATYVLYEKNLDYVQLVEKLENYFELALRSEPEAEAAGWIAHDALAVMTDNLDFARASNFVHRAIATLPEESWLLRYHLLGSIARLYVDPDNSPSLIQQGLAIYAENEERMRQRGKIVEASDLAYHQGLGVLFAFGDERQALEHFGRVSPLSTFEQDAKVFSALAWMHLNQPREVRSLLSQLDLQNNSETPMRLSFLRCYVEIIKQRLGDKANLNLCTALPDATQLDVIQHMTKDILQLPLSPKIETAVLKQFQNFYQDKMSPRHKQRLAQTVEGLELARAKAETNRLQYESQINRMEIDLAQKQTQLAIYIALSTLSFLVLMTLGFWRLQVQRKKLQQLQQTPTWVEEIHEGRFRPEDDSQKRQLTA